MSDRDVSRSLYARTVEHWVAKLAARTGIPGAALLVTLIAGVVVTLAGVGNTARASSSSRRRG